MKKGCCTGIWPCATAFYSFLDYICLAGRLWFTGKNRKHPQRRYSVFLLTGYLTWPLFCLCVCLSAQWNQRHSGNYRNLRWHPTPHSLCLSESLLQAVQPVCLLCSWEQSNHCAFYHLRFVAFVIAVRRCSQNKVDDKIFEKIIGTSPKSQYKTKKTINRFFQRFIALLVRSRELESLALWLKEPTGQNTLILEVSSFRCFCAKHRDFLPGNFCTLCRILQVRVPIASLETVQKQCRNRALTLGQMKNDEFWSMTWWRFEWPQK